MNHGISVSWAFKIIATKIDRQLSHFQEETHVLEFSPRGLFLMPSYYKNSLQPPPPTPWACGTYLCCPPNLVAAGVSTSSENPLWKHLNNTTPTGRIKVSAMTVGNIYFLHFSLQISWFLRGEVTANYTLPETLNQLSMLPPLKEESLPSPSCLFWRWNVHLVVRRVDS